LAKIAAGDELTEDSMDGPPPSVGSDSCPPSVNTPSQTSTQTPTTAKKPIKIFQKRMVTGYIIYSGEVRKGIASKNPEASFGEVSRMVGNDWRNLPAHVKSDYEERAQRLNEETAAEMARTGTDTPGGSAGSGGPSAPPHADLIFECCWQKCDYQFDDINDLTDHLLQEPNGHVLTTVNANGQLTEVLPVAFAYLYN
jgi:protein polybromo-1